MSNLRDLLSKANRKHEMRWKVLVFDPKKDNELVDEFKDFECIDCATAKKRELLEKHPDKTIEIIAESINRKTEAGKEIKVGNQRFYTTNDNGIILVRKIAPYDDADYYYAVYDPQKVRLVFTQSGGKNKQASMVKYNDTAKQIEEIAKKLIELNKHIQPKMVHESAQKNENTYGSDRYYDADVQNLRKKLTNWGLTYGDPNAPTERIVDKLVKAFPELAKHKKEIIDKVNAHKKKHYADYDDVAFEILFKKLTRTESAQKNEGKVNMSKLKNEIQAAVNKYFKDDKDLLEYVYIDTKKDKFGRDVLEVRAELGYNSMVKLADYLDKIVTKYDKYAYFDQETSGTMVAVFESSQKSEDKEGMNALKKLTKENKFIVYCDGHAKYCKTRQEAEAHAKAIKAGQVKDLLGRTIKCTEPVKIEEIHESVTKANYNEIIKVLSDTIAKAAKKYPEAKLVKNYQATTGSTGAFLDEGLHFTGKDAVSKAIVVSKELQNVMNKYGFKNDIGGILPYMIGNNYHSAIVTFGSVSQGSNGASVGYHYMKDALKFLESTQINETRGYKVIVELGVPDNMNNRDIEDEVERLLRSSRKIDVVIDVTAERN